MTYFDTLGQNFPKCVYKTSIFLITPPKKAILVKRTWGIILFYIHLLEMNVSL